MKFQQLVQNKMAHFGDMDRTICSYIYENQADIPKMSITTVAKASYTSKSSVLRFVQKLGFKGYSEFKYMVDWHGDQEGIQVNISIEDLTTYLNRVLASVKEDIQHHFFETVRSAQTIYLLATGTDQQIQAQNFARTFLKMNIVCTVIPGNNNVELANIVLENCNAKDLIIVFSGSGNNTQINDLLAIPLLKKTPVVSITVMEKNWLTKHSDINFSILADDNKSMLDFSSGACHLLIDFLATRFRLYVESSVMKEEDISK